MNRARRELSQCTQPLTYDMRCSYASQPSLSADLKPFVFQKSLLPEQASRQVRATATHSFILISAIVLRESFANAVSTVAAIIQKDDEEANCNYINNLKSEGQLIVEC